MCAGCHHRRTGYGRRALPQPPGDPGHHPGGGGAHRGSQCQHLVRTAQLYLRRRTYWRIWTARSPVWWTAVPSVGVESTILDLTCQPPRLLRPGGLPLEDLERLIGHIDVDHAVTARCRREKKPKAPGMKYRHLCPQGSGDGGHGSTGSLRPGDSAPGRKGRGHHLL